MRKPLLVVLFLIGSIVNIAMAGGFQINEHGARAMGMAGAFTAVANDPSALFFNPGGITQLSGTRFMLGATLITPKATFRGPHPQVTETKMVSQLFHPINFYATHQLTENLFVGLGVNNPYGLGTEWPSDWVGRTVTTKVDLKTFFITPTIGFKVSDVLSLGIGVDYVYSTVLLQRKSYVDPFVGEADIKLEGTGSGWGFRYGILAKPTDALSLGLCFRSEVLLNFTGDAESTGPALVAGNLPKGDVKTSVTTPFNLTFGAAYKVMPKLLLSADFQYINWSTYKELKVDFVDAKYNDLASPRNYKNAFIVRFGGEYNLTEKFAARAGLFYDKNPVPTEYLDPLLPDANRIGFNIGFGYDITRNLKADISYLFLRFNERSTEGKSEIPFDGVYNSSAHLFGFNLSYNL
ncbi:MAG: outer membrane protein transport protein [Ignavibacteria bacterium]|nr:outer membrane protein transport protein [Ignavibacteria bacterium]